MSILDLESCCPGILQKSLQLPPLPCCFHRNSSPAVSCSVHSWEPVHLINLHISRWAWLGLYSYVLNQLSSTLHLCARSGGKGVPSCRKSPHCSPHRLQHWSADTYSESWNSASTDNIINLNASITNKHAFSAITTCYVFAPNSQCSPNLLYCTIQHHNYNTTTICSCCSSWSSSMHQTTVHFLQCHLCHLIHLVLIIPNQWIH